MNRSITATAYFGYVFGRSVLAAIYPRGKNGSLGYLEAAYRF